jgi:hypothetical protein
MSDKVFVGDIGTDIIVDCGVDITGATPTVLKVEKPDGTTFDWTASIYQNNYLKHTTVLGDFDQAGLFKVQTSLTLGGWTGLGETDTFRVYIPFDLNS